MKYPIKYIGLKHLDWVGLALQTEMPSISKMLVMYLGRFMNNEQDVAWPSQSRICHELSISNGALNKHLSTLESEGWITRESGNSKKTTRYFITFPKKVESTLVETNSTLHEVEYNTPRGGVRVLHEVETNNNNNNKNNNKRSRFTPPTLEEVTQYCDERNNNINPEYFINYYEARGWKTGNTKIKDWKRCVITWELRDNQSPKVKNNYADGAI